MGETMGQPRACTVEAVAGLVGRNRGARALSLDGLKGFCQRGSSTMVGRPTILVLRMVETVGPFIAVTGLILIVVMLVRVAL